MLESRRGAPSHGDVPADLPAARPGARATVVALVAWAALVVAGRLVAVWTLPHDILDAHTAAPLHADVDVRVWGWVVLPLALGAAVAWWGPRAARAVSWWVLLVGTWALGAAWALSLASIRGWHRIAVTFRRDGEYRAVLPEISSVGGFLRDFVDRVPQLPTHVSSHPPGFTLVALGLDRVGLGGSWPLSLVTVAVGAVAAPAALVAARAVASEDAARRAAPFLVVAPAAIFAATSADAFFAGVAAVAVALVVVAVRARGLRSDVYAVVGGVVFGVTAFLSYGLVLLALVPVVVAVRERRLRPIVLAALGAAPVFLAFAAAGFWWPDGLHAARERYFAGLSRRRPYGTFLLANLSVFALVLGPATAAGLVRLRDRGLWLLVGGALAVVAFADLSGMSKAEVERIWLPFVPWVLLAGAALVPDPGVGTTRRVPPAAAWLALQAALAICIEGLIRTAW